MLPDTALKTAPPPSRGMARFQPPTRLSTAERCALSAPEAHCSVLRHQRDTMKILVRCAAFDPAPFHTVPCQFWFRQVPWMHVIGKPHQRAHRSVTFSSTPSRPESEKHSQHYATQLQRARPLQR
jgi:hypothetical protein